MLENAEDIRQLRSRDEIARLLERHASHYGFDYFLYRGVLKGLFSEPFLDSLIAHNLPPDWIDRYAAERIWEVDPFMDWARKSCAPFTWDMVSKELGLREENSLHLQFVRQVGLKDALAIPLRSGVGDLSIIKFLKTDEIATLGDADLARLFLCATTVHQRFIELERAESAQVGKLSLREAEAISLAARGMTVKQVARQMQVAPTTVETLLKRCQDKMGTRNRVASVVRALASGQALSTG